MLIPSEVDHGTGGAPSLSRRVNANSQLSDKLWTYLHKLIKKGEC